MALILFTLLFVVLLSPYFIGLVIGVRRARRQRRVTLEAFVQIAASLKGVGVSMVELMPAIQRMSEAFAAFGEAFKEPIEKGSTD